MGELRHQLGPVKQVLIALLLGTSLVSADSSIEEGNASFIWAQNLGFINLRPDQPAAPEGVVVSETYLSGYAYSANFGWIDFGDGTPANGYAYANDSATDYGVNMDPAGNLSGYAYGANIGWINFGWAAADDNRRPRVEIVPEIILVQPGDILGYAYAANFGWIHLGTAVLGPVSRTDYVARPDTDGDGIPDAWEWQRFAGLSTANEFSDSDGDTRLDAFEETTGTNPLDPNDFFRIVSLRPNDDGSSSQVTFTTRPGRRYFVDVAGDDFDFADSGLGWIRANAGSTTMRTVNGSPTTRRFFRARVEVPLLEPVPLVWGSVTLDTTDTAGQYASLAVSPTTGLPAIAYYILDGSFNGSLHFAEFDGTQWTTEQVDGNSGTSGNGAFCSLAFTPGGDPAISYLEGSPTNNLRYALRSGGSWAITVVDSSANVGRNTSLAFNAAGTPFIAYQEFASRDVKFAQFDNGMWQTWTAASTGALGNGISLAVDGLFGEPAIATYQSDFVSGDFEDRLEFLNFAGTSTPFGRTTVDDNLADSSEVVGRFPSVKFDPNPIGPLDPRPSVSYGGSALWFARLELGGWQIETVAGAAGATSLDYDPATDLPVIAYQDSGDDSLRLATFDGTNWSLETLDDHGTIGQFVSLAFSPDGIPHIAYHEEGNGELRYATLVPEPAP